MNEFNLVALQNAFKTAFEEGYGMVAVFVSVDGGAPEIIINPRENFEAKAEYYGKAYNEDLTLKSNPSIKIVAVIAGANLAHIQEILDAHIAKSFEEVPAEEVITAEFTEEQ